MELFSRGFQYGLWGLIVQRRIRMDHPVVAAVRISRSMPRWAWEPVPTLRVAGRTVFPCARVASHRCRSYRGWLWFGSTNSALGENSPGNGTQDRLAVFSNGEKPDGCTAWHASLWPV